MSRKLLLSGDRADFTAITFDVDKKQLRLIANYPGPFNVSWVEPSSSHGNIDRLIGLSEGLKGGLLYTCEIDHAQNTCRITSQQSTLGAPAHFITLQDRSALALATYLGGSVALYPISVTDESELRLEDAPRHELHPPFPYETLRHGPIKSRQRQCHVHQILEDRQGLLYASDLGSDCVWILHRDRMEMKVCGWLQCPPGTGARHAVFAPDCKIMYVLGELSHTIVAFDLSTGPANGFPPIHNFSSNIIPPSVHADHQSMMDSAELCVHPRIANVLYASNRWERHIASREPYLKNVPEVLAPGDAIAIILLSDDGKQVQDVKFIRTNLDTIRGMRFSGDGAYVAVAGQEGGGIEVYTVEGERGDSWKLVAGMSEGLESGIKHIVWL